MDATYASFAIPLSVIANPAKSSALRAALRITLKEFDTAVLSEPQNDEPAGVDALAVRNIDGRISIDDFARSTGIKLPEGGYETVAGFVITELGHIPEPGEHVAVTGGTVEVTEVVGNRVTRLTLHHQT